MTWSILNADVMEGLAALRPGSVQTTVTSPPYYGLRSYEGVPPRVWGGDPDHAHEWGPALGPHHPGQVEQTKWKTAEAAGKGQTAGAGSFCSCGAWFGCLGLEPSADLYLSHLVEVFRAVRRVMRADGVLWLNISDTYFSANNGSIGKSGLEGSTAPHAEVRRARGLRKRMADTDLKPGDRMGIPERLVLALQADGWTWRQTVVWEKRNPLPESVSGTRWEHCRKKVSHAPRQAEDRDGVRGPSRGERVSIPGNGGQGYAGAAWAPCPGCPRCEPNDGLVLRRGSWRPTTAHEYLYQLTPGPSYFSDGEAVRERDRGGHDSGNGFAGRMGESRNTAVSGGKGTTDQWRTGSGRNPRSVWSIPSEPFSGWTRTFRRVHVEPDALSGDTMRRASLGCRAHAGLFALASSALCGGHADAWLNHIERMPDHERGQLAEPAPTDQPPDDCFAAGSWGSGVQCSCDSASDRSTRIRKMVRALSTFWRGTPFEESVDHILRSESRPWFVGQHASIDGSNNGAACWTARQWLRTPDYIPRIAEAAGCSCYPWEGSYQETSHFATFPRRLIEPCILSSTPAAGSCSECGAPWAPVVERPTQTPDPGVQSCVEAGALPAAGVGIHRKIGSAYQRWLDENPRRTLGHRPTCSCGAPPRPALVLDPFAGSGTVGLVAIQHGRRFTGIERSPTYCAMARHRIGSADPEHVAAQPVRMAEISGPLFEVRQ